MTSLHFASTNRNKFMEVNSILSQYGVFIKLSNINLTEIQSDSIKDIALEKSKSAFQSIAEPVIVEDDGLFIDELNGFPGQYSSYVLKTIGTEGILELLSKIKNRTASFKSCVAYYDGKTSKSFEGEIKGKISKGCILNGWGYDPIFIPNGTSLTFGQLQIQNVKEKFSHRAKALKVFANWYDRFVKHS